MKEGKITKWLKKEGDKVSSGTAIAEVETDKSNREIEAYDDGVRRKILVPDGSAAPVGPRIAWIGKPGEKIDESPAPAPKQAAPPAPAAGVPPPLPPKAPAPK